MGDRELEAATDRIHDWLAIESTRTIGRLHVTTDDVMASLGLRETVVRTVLDGYHDDTAIPVRETETGWEVAE